MGSHFTSKVVPVVEADDSLTLSRTVEVFKCGDRNCPLLFFFPCLTLLIGLLYVCIYTCKNPGQEGKGAKNLIQIY